MQRRSLILLAAIGLMVLISVTAFLLFRPATPTPQPFATIETSPSGAATTSVETSSPPPDAPTAAGTPAPLTSSPASAAAPRNTVPNGTVFAFVNLVEPSSDRTAILTVDVAEIRPAEENAPSNGRNEITNPTVETERLIASASTRVDATAIDAGTMELSTWLTKRAGADRVGVALARSPYWIELRNGRIVRLRLQLVP